MVPASMAQPTEVVLTNKVLVFALASPTLLPVTHCPSSVGSASNLGPGLSLGYSIHGAGRQGDGGLLPEALRKR